MNLSIIELDEKELATGRRCERQRDAGQCTNGAQFIFTIHPKPSAWLCVPHCALATIETFAS